MAFAFEPYDPPTRSLMMAALETAWITAITSVPGLSCVDRARMAAAVLNAASQGERDSERLQQAALDQLGNAAWSAPGKRRHLRIVEGLTYRPPR